MEALLQELFGNNYETILGIVTLLSGGSIWGVSKYIKNKALKDAFSRVSNFFTKDMTPEEQNEFMTILKSLGTRKALRSLEKLVKVLEQFDLNAIKENFGEIRIAAFAILSVMITNGAFDDKPELKDLLNGLVGKYIA